MWCPGISALITMKLLKRNFRELGWKWGKTKYQFLSYLIPILYAVIAYAILVFGWGGFYNKEFVNAITDLYGLSAIGNGFTIVFYVFLLGILEQLQV